MATHCVHLADQILGDELMEVDVDLPVDCPPSSLLTVMSDSTTTSPTPRTVCVQVTGGEEHPALVRVPNTLEITGVQGLNPNSITSMALPSLYTELNTGEPGWTITGPLYIGSDDGRAPNIIRGGVINRDLISGYTVIYGPATINTGVFIGAEKPEETSPATINTGVFIGAEKPEETTPVLCDEVTVTTSEGTPDEANMAADKLVLLELGTPGPQVSQGPSPVSQLSHSLLAELLRDSPQVTPGTELQQAELDHSPPTPHNNSDGDVTELDHSLSIPYNSTDGDVTVTSQPAQDDDVTSSCDDARTILDKLEKDGDQADSRKINQRYGEKLMEHARRLKKELLQLRVRSRRDVDKLATDGLRRLIPKLTRRLYYSDKDLDRRGIYNDRPSDWPTDVFWADPCNKLGNGTRPKKDNLKSMCTHLYHIYEEQCKAADDDKLKHLL